MSVTHFKAFEVSESNGTYTGRIIEKRLELLQKGQVRIRVSYSSLNYKDALSAHGNKGVTRHYPHIPGIDAAGTVETSTVPEWKNGDQVIVTGFDLGMDTDGGFGQYISVPADWLVRLPEGLSLREAMIYGTAGFTAGLSVAALVYQGVVPTAGTVAVSGATGGVGSIAVAILAKLGFRVAAISSKAEAVPFLKELGAAEVIARPELEDNSSKALLKPRFAAAIDTVGGDMLSTLIRSIDYGGTVTTCGMVGGVNLSLTVFPFILKGIQLIGIDSVQLPLEKRIPVWQQLATDWKPTGLQGLAQEITLEDIPAFVEKIYHGQMTGRALVKL